MRNARISRYGPESRRNPRFSSCDMQYTAEILLCSQPEWRVVLTAAGRPEIGVIQRVCMLTPAPDTLAPQPQKRWPFAMLPRLTL